MSKKLSRKYFEWDFDRFYFFAAPDVHPVTLAVTFFAIERVTDNAFKLIQFVCIGIRMDIGIMRAAAAANGEVFPKLLTRKTFLLKRCDLFFNQHYFFVDFQSALNAICWFFFLYRLLSLANRYQLLHIHIIHKITKVCKIFSACMCVWKVLPSNRKFHNTIFFS